MSHVPAGSVSRPATVGVASMVRPPPAVTAAQTPAGDTETSTGAFPSSKLRTASVSRVDAKDLAVHGTRDPERSVPEGEPAGRKARSHRVCLQGRPRLDPPDRPGKRIAHPHRRGSDRDRPHVRRGERDPLRHFQRHGVDALHTSPDAGPDRPEPGGQRARRRSEPDGLPDLEGERIQFSKTVVRPADPDGAVGVEDRGVVQEIRADPGQRATAVLSERRRVERRDSDARTRAVALHVRRPELAVAE